jgi:hypothetical protein
MMEICQTSTSPIDVPLAEAIAAQRAQVSMAIETSAIGPG